MAGQCAVDEDDVLGKLDVGSLGPVREPEHHQVAVEFFVVAEDVGRVFAENLSEQVEVVLLSLFLFHRLSHSRDNVIYVVYLFFSNT